MTLLQEIDMKRRELYELEKKYEDSTNPCINSNCSYHNKSKNGCGWTLLIETCSDYIPEKEDE